MSREFDVIVERDADGFCVASVPALRGCHIRAKPPEMTRSCYNPQCPQWFSASRKVHPGQTEV